MKLLIFCKLLVLSALATSCGPGRLLDADTSELPLAGPYYLRTDYEGYSQITYGSGWLQSAPVLLGSAIDSVGEVGPYLAVCKGDEVPRHYYLLPLAAVSAAQAEARCLGPLDAVAYHQWRRQLIGYTVQPLAPVSR